MRRSAAWLVSVGGVLASATSALAQFGIGATDDRVTAPTDLSPPALTLPANPEGAVVLLILTVVIMLVTLGAAFIPAKRTHQD